MTERGVEFESVNVIENPLSAAELKDLLNRADLSPVRVFGNSSLSSIVRMTLDGIGISAIPPAVIGKELAERRLRILPSNMSLPKLAYTASYLSTPDNVLPEIVAQLAQSIAQG